MNQENRKRLNFTCRFQPQANSNEGLLLSYLSENYTGGLTKSLFESASLLWLPLALSNQDKGGKSSSLKSGRISVMLLIRHIEYLCTLLEIEPPVLNAYFPLNPNNKPIVNVKPEPKPDVDNIGTVIEQKKAKIIDTSLTSSLEDESILKNNLASEWDVDIDSI